MSMTLGGITFDRVVYDREGDVLYLHVGDPSAAVDFDESVEGDGLRFDQTGRLVGVTILRPRWRLQQGETITVSIPAPRVMKVEPAELERVIDAA